VGLSFDSQTWLHSGKDCHRRRRGSCACLNAGGASSRLIAEALVVSTHQGAVLAHQLDYYLDEYTFRFNRRTSRSRGLLFYRLLEQAVSIESVTNRDIVEENP
jgi:hypothetical protein